MTSLLLLLACHGGGEPTPPVSATRLIIDTPAAGAWVEPGPVEVSGLTAGLTEVTVNGVAATLDGDRFTATITADPGITAFEVSGLDAAGDTVFERRSVLAGEFGPTTGQVPRAVSVHLSAAGVNELLGITLAGLDVDALTAQATALNPVVSGDLFGFSYAVDLLDVSISPPAVGLGFRDDGTVAVSVVLDDIEVAVRASGALSAFPAIGLDTDAVVSVDRVTAALDVTLGAAGGKPTVDLGPIAMDLEGFAFDAELIPNIFEDVIYLVEEDLEDYVIGLLTEQITTLAPSLVDTFTSALSLAFSTELMGKTLSVDAAFRRIATTSAGAELVVDLGVTVDGGDPNLRYAGVLTAPAAPHEPPTDSDLGISLHDDLLNRLLFEVWRGGLLDLTLTSADQPLLGSLFGQLGAEDGQIVVHAGMPPVAVERDGSLQLDLGELDLRIETPGGDFGEYAVLRMAGRVPIDPVVSEGALGVDVGEPALSLMVVDTDWRASRSTITNLMEDQLPIDALLSVASLFSFPLPAFAGIQIETALAERAASGVHTTVAVDLGAAP